MKRLLFIVMALVLAIAMPVSASKPVWLDLNSDALLTAKSAVIMPMLDANGVAVADMNQYMLKKGQGVKAIGSWSTSSVAGISLSKYEPADIAQAMSGKTDILVVPFLTYQSSEPVESPGTQADVLLKSWEEIKDDSGTHRHHEREHYATVWIPEETIYVNQTGVDFYVYDKNGQLVMTLSDVRYNHNSNDEQIKNLINNFFDEMKDSIKLLKKYNKK